MKTYLAVILIAVTVYWFKDIATDYLLNDVKEDTKKEGLSLESEIRLDSFKDRSTKEMNRFIKPGLKPEIKVDKNELKKKLSPIEFEVTQNKGTERPFSGKYLKLNDNGMYTCVVCNEELFSSDHKYDSGCGWPAFHSIQNISKVTLTQDTSHIGANLLLLLKNKDQIRTEVSCAKCGAHLGHVFDDGPTATKTRFCINSASLKFKKDAFLNDQSKNEN